MVRRDSATRALLCLALVYSMLWGKHWIHWDRTAWGSDNELETDSGEAKNQPFPFL